MILVTGGTGLLGSHLLYELLQDDKPVSALMRKGSDVSFVKKVFSYYTPEYESLFSKISWIAADINDVCALDEAIKGAEYVYHTAAVVSFDHKEAPLMKKVNTEGTANVVNACLANGIKKLCYTSSVAALGREDSNIPVTESSPWIKDIRKSVYSQSKYDAEQEVWRGVAEGLAAVIVNPAIILGPGAWHKGSSKLFETVWKGQKFFTRGINGFVDVRDVARIMKVLMNSGIKNERFIVSSGNHSYENVLKLMADSLHVSRPKYHAGKFLSELAWRAEYLRSKLTGHQPLITKETAHTAQNRHYYSNKKIVDALFYKFLPIEECIKATAEIYLREQ